MAIDNLETISRDEAPPVALWVVAILALSPFPIAALANVYGSPDVSRRALAVVITWSAMVLSFLGGVRWGMETLMPSPRLHRQVISLASAIAGCLLLLGWRRLENEWVLGGLIAAFLLQWLFDHQAPDVPARYPKLSTAVTAAACISLGLCLDQALKT